jgi:FtsH-binding integral membrane protein
MKTLPDFMMSNNPLYNIHSVVRFTCYSLFFIGLGQQKLNPVYKALPIVSLLIFIVNFTLVDDFFNPAHLSGNLLAGEAYLLLIYCMLYYLFKLRDDDTTLSTEPDFWAVTGLAIYVVANFFVFLFYVPMIQADPKMANDMWDVHNYAYITLCLFTAKAMYDATRYQYSV